MALALFYTNTGNGVPDWRNCTNGGPRLKYIGRPEFQGWCGYGPDPGANDEVQSEALASGHRGPLSAPGAPLGVF